MNFFPATERRTLAKADKLTLKAEFDYVWQHGRKVVSSALVAVVAPGEKVRCGVICGKKYSLLSVKRNRARRLMWESFRLLKPAISPCTLILIPRQKMAHCMRQQVTGELAKLLAQVHQIPQEVADLPPDA